MPAMFAGAGVGVVAVVLATLITKMYQRKAQKSSNDA